MKTKTTFLLTLVCCMALCSCTDSDDNNVKNNIRTDIVLTRAQQDIVDSQARFAFDFFKRTASYKDAMENIVISPLSLSIDLAMLANGADKPTYDYIVELTQLPDTDIEEINVLYSRLVSELIKADSKVELSIANAIWNDKDVIIKEDFGKNICNHYNAIIKTLDFSNPDNIRNTINTWAAEKTNGKLGQIFKQDNDFLSSAKFILCNAMYFNGKWTIPFNKKNTGKQVFNNIDNTESMVQTMSMMGTDYLYVATDIGEIIRLPYGNEAFSMYVILPDVANDNKHTSSTLEDFINALDYDWWTTTRDMMTSTCVNLKFPKFRIECNCPLIGTAYFQELSPITSSPKLTYMTDSEIDILEINQSNILEVSEEGTEVATITHISGMETALPKHPIELNIDRPFIYLIEEQSTGAILFMGRVVKL